MKWNTGIQDLKCENIQQIYEVTVSNRFEALMQEDLDVDECSKGDNRNGGRSFRENSHEGKKWISSVTMRLIERDN